MSNRPIRNIPSLDGYSTCEMKQVFEDIARWKGQGAALEHNVIAGVDRYLLRFPSDGITVMLLSERRGIAVCVCWDDIPADRSYPNESEPT